MLENEDLMAVNISVQCSLCGGSSNLFFEMPDKKYHQCGQCSGVFLDQACYVSREAEKKRYEEHNNDVNNPRYQKFVEPVVLKIQEKFSTEHKGLDYGAGTGPVVAKMLEDKGYFVELYDPYFRDNPEALQRKYDFIVCCEVIEHFNAPAKEFARLRSLLTPGGVLFCMTDPYSEDTDFKNWYYKNDPTHVFFYHQKSLLWIKSQYRFSGLKINGRLAQFFL